VRNIVIFIFVVVAIGYVFLEKKEKKTSNDLRSQEFKEEENTKIMKELDLSGSADVVAKINGRILLSSDKLVNEGFDVPRLDTLIRLMPTTETKQTVGRVMRTHPGKVTPVCIIEVDDICSPMLHNMWRKRVKEIQNGDKHGPFTSGPCTVETIEMKACTLGPIQSRRRYRARKYM
jgi:superfamily II DNA or RNA helicase